MWLSGGEKREQSGGMGDGDLQGGQKSWQAGWEVRAGSLPEKWEWPVVHPQRSRFGVLQPLVFPSGVGRLVGFSKMGKTSP